MIDVRQCRIERDCEQKLTSSVDENGKSEELIYTCVAFWTSIAAILRLYPLMRQNY